MPQKLSQTKQFKFILRLLKLFEKNIHGNAAFLRFQTLKIRTVTSFIELSKRRLLFLFRIITGDFLGLRKNFQKNFPGGRKSSVFGVLNKAGKNSLYITLYSTAFLGAKLLFPTEARILADFCLKWVCNPPSNGAKNLTKKNQVAIIRAAVHFRSG